jgi:hypothetical protein
MVCPVGKQSGGKAAGAPTVLFHRVQIRSPYHISIHVRAMSEASRKIASRLQALKRGMRRYRVITKKLVISKQSDIIFRLEIAWL